MQPVRDRDRTPDQHSYFYVVWPEEKSELPLSPPTKKETEQPSPGLDLATSGSSSREAIAAGGTQVMSSATSRRYTESPVQSAEVDYLTSRQQQVSSPLTLDLVQSKSTPVTSNYSPSMTAHSQRPRGSTGHQMITLPASTVVPTSQAQLLLSSEVTTFTGGSSEMQKELGGNHVGDSRMSPTIDTSRSMLLPQSQKQVLHLGNPVSVARNQDVHGGFKRIGVYKPLCLNN